MIPVQDAKNQILVGTHPLNEINIALLDAPGYALASDLHAPFDFPDFDQSAMDGYGIYFEEGKQEPFYSVVGEEQAGNVDFTNTIQKGEAIRIFTGAKIPKGVNTVVQQEWVDRGEERIVIEGRPILIGMNIRKTGSQTKKGDLLLQAGATLQPASVSFLAAFGFADLPVIRKPDVIILNTGKELVPPGHEKKIGQVYESNSYALVNALKCMHIQALDTIWVDDDEKQLAENISQALSRCDLLIITGGVSVGDYDYVVGALANNGVQQIFHKLKQKPGKPLYFGNQADKLVFGLPGNPASVLTCFYQYVYPCIRKMMGFSQLELMQLYLPALNTYEKKAGMTHFLKGRVENSAVELLGHQESYKMNTFGFANALVQIDEDQTFIKENQLVRVYLLPV